MTRHIATTAPSLTGGEMIQRTLGQPMKMACLTQRCLGRLPEHYCARCSWLQTIILVQFLVRFVQQLMICGFSFAVMNDCPPGPKFRKFGACARKALWPEQFQAILVERLHERKDCRYDGTTPTEASSHCRVEGGGAFLFAARPATSDEVSYQRTCRLSVIRCEPKRYQKAINQMFIHIMEEFYST